MNKYRLVARPVWIPGESPASVLIRAVEGNGYPNLQALVWAYWRNGNGRGWAKAAYTDPARYRRIMQALGISLPEEQLACFTRNGPTSESARLVDGLDFPEKLFREDARYYCPACLRERAFWRKRWTFRPFSVCPEHHVHLLMDCPSCGAFLSTWRGKLTKCDCGADLADASSAPADPSTLNWWLARHNQSRHSGHVADTLFLALAELDGPATDPPAEHRRLCAARTWLETGNIEPWLLEGVSQRATSVHPRIQLLPLLRSDLPELEAMARTILQKCPVYPFPQIPVEYSSMSRRDAQLSLGIADSHYKHFLKHHLLDFPNDHQLRRGQVSFVAVNRLLFALQTASISMSDGEGCPLTRSLATMVVDVLSGNRAGAGYDLAEGLTTLRFRPQLRGELDGEFSLPHGWLDINNISAMLATYPEAIRSLAKKGWIPFRDRDMRGRKRLIARREDVEHFRQCYVLAGTLATEIRENPTNLAEKLMALGVPAIAGPRIDGTLIYVFKRSEIEELDLTRLRTLSHYPTKTGRKPNSTSSLRKDKKQDVMTAAEAASLLDIRVQDVHILIRNGLLVSSTGLQRSIHVTRRSLRKLQQLLGRTGMLSVEEAARLLKVSPRTVESLWVKSGVLAVQDLGLWRQIAIADLEKLEQLLVSHVTASEAGRILGTHRSHLPNLERGGHIRAKLIGSKRRIRLYARLDVEKLMAHSISI